MNILAVLDTNVVVSALITKNPNSPTVKVLKAVLQGVVIPVYHDKIISEYLDVLSRPKFELDSREVEMIVSTIEQLGVEAVATSAKMSFLDENDRVFYEVTLTKKDDGACLITGNRRHFPEQGFVVTPAEFVKMFEL